MQRWQHKSCCLACSCLGQAQHVLSLEDRRDGPALNWSGDGITERIDAAFFQRRVQAAVAMRERLGIQSNGVRLVHGEADGLPGLPQAVEAFKTALAEARAAEDHLRTVLTEGGWLT